MDEHDEDDDGHQPLPISLPLSKSSTNLDSVSRLEFRMDELEHDFEEDLKQVQVTAGYERASSGSFNASNNDDINGSSDHAESADVTSSSSSSATTATTAQHQQHDCPTTSTPPLTSSSSNAATATTRAASNHHHHHRHRHHRHHNYHRKPKNRFPSGTGGSAHNPKTTSEGAANANTNAAGGFYEMELTEELKSGSACACASATASSEEEEDSLFWASENETLANLSDSFTISNLPLITVFYSWEQQETNNGIFQKIIQEAT